MTALYPVDRGGTSTLVTCPHAVHSKATNPGSPTAGAMVTTSFIADPHFAHDGASASVIFTPPLFIDSVFVVTARAPFVRAAARFGFLDHDPS
jgi:hypothetical protein